MAVPAIITKLKSKKSFLWSAFIFVIFFIFFTNGLHEKYPDEFDNILGGRYIAEGRVIYKDFFTHHGPGAYWLSALIYMIGGGSFVVFRLIYSALLLGWLLFSYWFINRSVKERLSNIFLFYIVATGILATYVWTHMLLADALAAYLFIPVYVLLLLKSLYHKKLSGRDILFSSFVTGFMVMTSLTYLYVAVIVYLWLLYVVFWRDIGNFSFKGKIISLGKVIGLLAIPYLFFIGYLLITGSLRDFLFQNIEYNGRYYIYNYPKPEGSLRVNPIRYAVVIAYEFYNNFHVLVTRIGDFGFDFPLNVTFAVANLAMIIILIYRRKYMVGLILIMLMIYSNVRSNPLDFGEKDYQSAVYANMSLFNIGISLLVLKEELDKKGISYSARVIFTTTFIVLGAYTLPSTIFSIRKFNEKVYGKYMGISPLIYDRPEIAPVFNAVLDEKDYMWIGPFHFEEMFYIEAKPASKYHILLPEFGIIDEVQKELISDLRRNQPRLIWFDIRYSVRNSFPTNYGQFLIDYLKQDYIALIDYVDDNVQYKSVKSITTYYDPEVHLFIRRDKIQEVVQSLLQANIIKQVAIATDE